jgi:hypothetical protein
MALDTTKTALDLHVLVKIELTGKTLYYADRNLTMSDGIFYEGRAKVSALNVAFNSLTEPKMRQVSVTIMLDNRGEELNDLLEDYQWGNRSVSVYIGEGRDLSNYSLDFQGKVRFPDGITFDSDMVKVAVRDRRTYEYEMIPAGTFTATLYPNMEEKSKNFSIPIVYGDWTDGDESCPAVCVDTTVNEFKICAHAILSISQVYKNGTAVSHTNEDLTNAKFRIGSYDPVVDVVTVKFEGKKNAGGALIVHPVDMIEDMLTDYVSIDSGDIDSTSFSDAKAASGSEMKARRFIRDERSTNTLIMEIANEVGLDLYIRDGDYTLRYREPSVDVDSYFDETDIVQNSFSVQIDPDRLYLNRIRGRYRYDPGEEKYIELYIQEDTAEQADALQTVYRKVDFEWLYRDMDVQAIIQRLLLLYKSQPEVVEVALKYRGLLKFIADQVGLTFSKYTQQPMQIREFSKDFASGTNRVTLWEVLSFVKIGHWTEDSPVFPQTVMDDGAWSGSSSGETWDKTWPANMKTYARSHWGYWTDDNGYIDPTDPDSLTLSMWF